MIRTLTTEYSHLTDEMTDLTVLYARLSKDDGKSGDSDSILNQKMLLEDFAKKERFQNCVFFSDDGISGTTFNRPAFEEAMRLVKSGRVKNFVVKDQSRLGRDYLTVGMLMEVVFPDNDVRFIAISDNYDSEKEADNQMAPIRNLFNEFYARDTSKKIKAVKHAKGNAGEPIGGSLPYGYLKGENYKQTKIWLVDAEAAEIVRRIFRECIAGKSLLAIAEGLEKDKILIPSRHKVAIGENVALRGAKPYLWSFDVVRSILENEAYLGSVVNFKTYKKSYKSKKCLPNPRENWVIIPNHHEAIIDQETFNLVNQLRRTNRPRRTNSKRIGLFSGLAFCADCGRRHHYDSQRGISSAYFCSGRTSRLRYCESYHRILERDLSKSVSEHFARVQSLVKDQTSNFVEELRRSFEENDSKELLVMKRRFEDNEKRISEIDSILLRLYEDNVLGKVSDSRFAKMSEDFEQEQKKLTSQNFELNAELEKSETNSKNVDNFLILAKKAFDLKNLTPETVRELLERIEISEKEIDGNGEQIQNIRLIYRFIGDIAGLENQINNEKVTS